MTTAGRLHVARRYDSLGNPIERHRPARPADDRDVQLDLRRAPVGHRPDGSIPQLLLRPDQRQPPEHHLSRRQQPAVCLRRDRPGHAIHQPRRPGRRVTPITPTACCRARPSPTAPRTRFTYDDHDNLISMTDSTGTTTFAYDSADRLTKVTYPDGDVPRIHVQCGRTAASR